MGATHTKSKIIFLQFYVYQYKENICEEIHQNTSYVIICTGEFKGHFYLILYTFLNCFNFYSEPFEFYKMKKVK